MTNLKEIQTEHKIWRVCNFPHTEPWHPILGMQEELGELSHAYLKMVQGIRGSTENHEAEARDAVGDLLIFCIDFCSQMGWSIQEILDETWEEVKKRDWQKNRETGV